MSPLLSLILLVTCTVITSSAFTQKQEQTLLLEQRRETLRQRLQQLEQSNYNDLIANRVAAYHLDQQRRLLRAKLKRGLQSNANAYPGVIKHFGVHPMGFRYFVGYQKPLSSRYLPPTGSINKIPYNYYPEQRPQAARPSTHYGPPQPSVEVHPIDTPSVAPPQPPEPETPRPIINTVQFPARRPDNPIQPDGSRQNPTTTTVQIIPQSPSVEIRPIQPVVPQPPVVQSQPAPPPTIIIQQRPNPNPPIHLQPVPNAFPIQPFPQTPVYHLQPVPNAVPIQPQTPVNFHPAPNAFPLQPLPQIPFNFQPVSNGIPVQPNPQQIPVHLHPVPNAFPVQPIPQQPVHLHPVPNAFPVQPISQSPVHLHPVQTPYHFHPQFLRPAVPLQPQPAVVPQQPPVFRVPSITINPVNPLLRPVFQTNIPVGTSFSVAPAGPPNFIPKTGLVPLPLPQPGGVQIRPGNAVETSYSATFPKVPYIQNIPNGLFPLPTGPHGQILPNGQPIPLPLLPNQGQLIPLPPNQGQLIPLPQNQGQLIPLPHNQIPFITNGHLPPSIHPPNISLEPPYIKRIDKN